VVIFFRGIGIEMEHIPPVQCVDRATIQTSNVLFVHNIAKQIMLT